MTEALPPLDARAGHSAIRLRLAAVAVTVTLLVAVRLLSGSGGIDRAFERPLSPSAFGIALAIVLVAHLALVPLELLAVLAGAAFGSGVGGGTALAGGWLGAAVGYVVGRGLGLGQDHVLDEPSGLPLGASARRTRGRRRGLYCG